VLEVCGGVAVERATALVWLGRGQGGDLAVAVGTSAGRLRVVCGRTGPPPHTHTHTHTQWSHGALRVLCSHPRVLRTAVANTHTHTHPRVLRTAVTHTHTHTRPQQWSHSALRVHLRVALLTPTRAPRRHVLGTPAAACRKGRSSHSTDAPCATHRAGAAWHQQQLLGGGKPSGGGRGGEPIVQLHVRAEGGGGAARDDPSPTDLAVLHADGALARVRLPPPDPSPTDLAVLHADGALARVRLPAPV
jgi:hypothetical protein